MKNRYRNHFILYTMSVLVGLGTISWFLLMTGCSRNTGNRVQVMVELPAPNLVDFEKFATVLYKDLTLEAIPQGFDPLNEINTFFLQDLGRSMNKTIAHWEREKHGEMVPTKLLIISGNLKVDIKSRSKIEDVKAEGKLKKKKEFVTVQHWEMTLSLIMTDATTNKEIFKEDFKAKLANVDSTTPRFNFENLFFKVTGDFVKKITRTKKMQRRYIIL